MTLGVVNIVKKKVFKLVFIFGTILAIAQLQYLYELEAQGQTYLRKFLSYEELKDFMTPPREVPDYFGNFIEQLKREFGITRPTSATGKGMFTSDSAPPDYSTTNIQVEGVDEADFVKTDGEFIYLGSGGNITILKAYPAEDAEILSQIRLNGTLKGIFINEDKMSVLEQSFGSYRTVSTKTSVKVYNVTNRENPVLERKVSLDGSYFSSRMIDDYVYTLISCPASGHKDEVVLPKIYVDDEVE